MASTGVPPTGRSRAFANRFSGFHRAKRLIGGSSLTGVSVATGVRRSRTRIDPCFRAARTHAPVRRCSSLIEISFMCHIVTHRSSHRQAMAHRSRNVLSQLLGRPTGQVIVPRGRCFGGIVATKSPIRPIETKTRGSRRHPTDFWDIECRPRWAARELHSGSAGKPAVSQSQSRHTLLHTKNSLIAPKGFPQQTLAFAGVSSKDAGPKDRRPAASRDRWNCQSHIYLRSAVRWPRG
jgi:hypothetical protein